MKKLILFTVAAAAFCCFGEFAAYVDVSIQNFNGNPVNEAFPVLVKVNESKIPGFYAAVKNAGADLKFTDGNGIGDYPYEIDTWNPSGTSLIWVRLPSFSSSTVFCMYYGDANVTSHSWSVSDVWNGYAGVWHMNGGDDSSVGHATSTLTDENVTGAGMVGASLGRAAHGTGPIMIAESTALTGLAALGEFTVSSWIKVNIVNGCSWKNFFAFKNSDAGASWGANFYNDAGYVSFNAAGGSYNGVHYTAVGTAFSSGEWAKYDIVFSATNYKLFVNGVEIPLNYGSTAAPANCWYTKLAIGGVGEVPGSGMAADHDEFRILSTAISSSRVAADYAVVTSDVCRFGEPQIKPTVVIKPNGIRIY